MKTKQLKMTLLIGCLIAVTCIALAGSGKNTPAAVQPAEAATAKGGIVTLTGNLVQDKILVNGNGIVSLALTMSADDIVDETTPGQADGLNNVDMVIVLDRSGSMSGQKIRDAKNAAIELVSRLNPSDRFGLVTYSDNARLISDLVYVTTDARTRLSASINNISAGGGTNLGQGLQAGIDMLTLSQKTGNTGRLILISDGLANKGVTDINALGKMAAIAVQKEFSVSTAGVGNDFNETLMTAIADYGTGNYYFMENPEAFASVFNNEFEHTRTVAASSVRICFNEQSGVKFVDAGGYPVIRENGAAVFYPGDIRSGETRKLFLSLQVPTDRVTTFDIPGINLQYRHNGNPFHVALPDELKLSCVSDPSDAMASIDKKIWENKVLQEDFSRLKEKVAADLRKGRQTEAVQKIEAYYDNQQAINAGVGSAAIEENLDHDLLELRNTVDETFTGKPSAVAEKQKKNAKVLQFEGYRERRKN